MPLLSHFWDFQDESCTPTVEEFGRDVDITADPFYSASTDEHESTQYTPRVLIFGIKGEKGRESEPNPTSIAPQATVAMRQLPPLRTTPNQANMAYYDVMNGCMRSESPYRPRYRGRSVGGCFRPAMPTCPHEHTRSLCSAPVGRSTSLSHGRRWSSQRAPCQRSHLRICESINGILDASAAMGAASDADSDAVAREAAGVAQQLAQMPPRPTNPRTAGLS
mmetsp:Transcript_20042/g.63875  ORF Transcript_20042/g.63875 Transcript_20042/m.63875 type:complete len:221 (+) Transcript_20042:37-699(+)